MIQEDRFHNVSVAGTVPCEQPNGHCIGSHRAADMFSSGLSPQSKANSRKMQRVGDRAEGARFPTLPYTLSDRWSGKARGQGVAVSVIERDYHLHHCVEMISYSI